MSDKLVMFTTVVLDAPRRIRYRPGVFRYRFGQIKRPITDLNKGLRNGKTFDTALCQWLWAVIDEDCDLDSPEAVAEAIGEKTVDEKIELATELIKCINLYKPPAESKNVNGSTPAPLPTSS